MNRTSNASRRSVVWALAAAALAPSAARSQPRPQTRPPVEWTDEPAFVTGPLAADPLARLYKRPAPGAAWPEVPLIGPGGRQTLGDWRGKTLLVTLWAEWCAPCLAEMPALARLNGAYRSKSFEILPIMTGSHALRTYAQAQDRLSAVKGADIATLLDGGPDGRALMSALAQSKLPPGTTLPAGLPPGAIVSTTSLPCLVVVDPAGRLRGRALGMPTYDGKTVWATAAGEAFIKRLAAGPL
jgi:thiol-disulfide isomerase/thioredoxin